MPCPRQIHEDIPFDPVNPEMKALLMSHSAMYSLLDVEKKKRENCKNLNPFWLRNSQHGHLQ
jgi:hypothetical protein